MATMTASTTYVFCYFAENVTDDLLSISDSFYQSNWYQYPAKQQRTLFMLAIRRAQSECRMSGLGLVDCSLGVYTLVWMWVVHQFLFLERIIFPIGHSITIRPQLCMPFRTLFRFYGLLGRTFYSWTGSSSGGTLIAIHLATNETNKRHKRPPRISVDRMNTYISPNHTGCIHGVLPIW